SPQHFLPGLKHHQHRAYAGHFLRGTRVNALHSRVRVGRERHFPVEQAGTVHVVGVFRPPGGLHRPVHTVKGFSDQKALVSRWPVIVRHHALLALRRFAASSAASRTPIYVPQRHRFPPRPPVTSSYVGLGWRFKNAVTAITNPGVQKPHCCASCSTKAAETGDSWPSAARPSIVVIS